MHLIIPQTVQACQVDFPADKVKERSVKGALHIRPGSLEMTPDEWAHIKKHHQALAAQIEVVNTEALAALSAPAKAAEEPTLKKEEPLPEAMPAAEEPAEAKPSKKK